MTWRAGRLYAAAIRASTVGRPPTLRHSSRSFGPAARWIAPSTPPPPSRLELAAFTMASTFCSVTSPMVISMRLAALLIKVLCSRPYAQRPRRAAERADQEVIVIAEGELEAGEKNHVTD